MCATKAPVTHQLYLSHHDLLVGSYCQYITNRLTNQCNFGILLIGNDQGEQQVMSTEKQFITVLGPNDPDDGDEGRQSRGLAAPGKGFI